MVDVNKFPSLSDSSYPGADRAAVNYVTINGFNCDTLVSRHKLGLEIAPNYYTNDAWN